MRSYAWADRECERVGEVQEGVLALAQIFEAGHTRRSFEGRVKAGALERLHTGVYGLPGTPETWRKRLTAAYLWAQPGGCLSHRSAAALYELDGIPPNLVEVSMSSARRSRPGVISHRFATGERPRTRFLGNLEVTLLERTIFDLGAVLPGVQVGRAMDDALRRRMTTLDRLWAELQDRGGRGRSGSAVLRRLLGIRDDRDGLAESVLETDMLGLLRTPLLPRVTVQHVVVAAGAHPPRLDFSYPEYLLDVEAHSYRHHSAPDQIKKDAARENRLELLGWTILHYTWDDIHFEGDRVISEIRQMLTGLGAQL